MSTGLIKKKHKVVDKPGSAGSVGSLVSLDNDLARSDSYHSVVLNASTNMQPMQAIRNHIVAYRKLPKYEALSQNNIDTFIDAIYKEVQRWEETDTEQEVQTLKQQLDDAQVETQSCKLKNQHAYEEYRKKHEENEKTIDDLKERNVQSECVCNTRQTPLSLQGQN